MPNKIKHRKVNIVILMNGETVLEHCRAGDIAIVSDQAGWWTQFVSAGGSVEGYDTPFASYDEAMWAAKAAAEYGFD